MQIKIYFGRFYYHYIYCVATRMHDNVFIIVYTTMVYEVLKIHKCVSRLTAFFSSPIRFIREYLCMLQ